MTTKLENGRRYAPGTRIYYTGDRANQPSTGTITRFRPADKWGPESVDIEFDEERFEGDDDRKARGICCLGFEPGPGRRFWLLADWQAERRRKIEEMQRAFPRS